MIEIAEPTLTKKRNDGKRIRVPLTRVKFFDRIPRGQAPTKTNTRVIPETLITNRKNSKGRSLPDLIEVKHYAKPSRRHQGAQERARRTK